MGMVPFPYNIRGQIIPYIYIYIYSHNFNTFTNISVIHIPKSGTFVELIMKQGRNSVSGPLVVLIFMGQQVTLTCTIVLLLKIGTYKIHTDSRAAPMLIGSLINMILNFR
jgi:hypothetical protein